MRIHNNHIAHCLLTHLVEEKYDGSMNIKSCHPELVSGSKGYRNTVPTGKQKFGVTFIFFFLLSFSSFGQSDINAMEYYVDNDPGFGNATPITITTGSLVDLPLATILASALPTGFHTLGVRARNILGDWGFTEKRKFYIAPAITLVTPIAADINAMEYYIDTDPGYGAATAISVTTGSLVDLPNEIIAASTLPTGFHTLGIRSKNTDGAWGFPEKRQFYIPAVVTITTPVAADIQTLEYFFDVDPGFGNATAITITTGQALDINELIPENLTSGFHHIHIRAKNTDGSWGLSESRPVYVLPVVAPEGLAADITKIEYYFDGADPGVGNGTDLPITPGQLIDLNPALVPTSPTLVDGPHYITFRAMNADNVWGMAEIDTFDVLDDCTQPIAGFTPSLACAGQTVTFVDNSTNTDSSATYRWYLNGDAIIDDTIIGDATFTYPFPGTYVVALAIRQGTICFDSITTTIDIQLLPVAVFSISGTAVNQTTTFTASVSNLQAGAIWEWDFNEDNIVDDTSIGGASYTYTSEGTYNPSLTITDGLGCSVTTTNSIAITGPGTTAPPLAGILADNGCVGNTINFIDLSQNILSGSTYSWDFDGDGTEDSSTEGAQTFTYTVKGSYTAKLIIDLGTSTIEASQQIEIVDIPTAGFSAADVCDGTAMDFNDLSNKTDSTTVYMWDFDNDGIVDSNTKTGVANIFPNAGPHIVSLSVSNNYGCISTIVQQVNVIALPAPDFEWDIVCTGEPITFNNLSSSADSDAVFSWDLDGDGTEDFSTPGDVAYTFTTNGSFNSALTITNPAGCAETVAKAIEIFDRPEVAMEIIAQCYGQESQMVDLSQNVSSTATYSWDFNSDGIEDDTTVGSTSYSYASYNSYVVALTIDNGGGCSGTNNQLVVFSDAATPDFSVNKLCQGEPVVFTDLSTNLEVGALYSWDFNGNGLEDAAIPGSTDYIYPDTGLYNATLTIDNGGNCLAYKTIALDVTPPPAIDLGSDLYLCEAGTVTFDAGTGYSSYLWPDGSSDNSFTTDQIGSYMVRVQDAKGCFNYDTISVALMGEPVPSFSHAIELSLEGIKVSFINNTTNADAYVWSFGDDVTSDEAEPSHIYNDFSFYATSVYTVCLTATNACEEAQICEDIFVSPTQILQEGNDEIKVYPNPANQFIYVELSPLSQTGSKLALVDIKGKTLWFSNNLLSRHEIDISNLSKGLYYLILEQDNGFLYKKLMKN